MGDACGTSHRACGGHDGCVVENEMLGKPAGRARTAKRMLRLLAGRVHAVVTGVTALPSGSRAMTRVESTEVEFGPLSAEEIDLGSCHRRATRDKAGAYAIQGGASRFVTRIAGSYH